MASATMTVPIGSTPEGVLLVSETRVTLDTVVTAFLYGAAAEEIVLHYPSLKLADVYAILGYYLQHQDEIDTYLRQRQQRAEAVRAQNEARFPPEAFAPGSYSEEQNYRRGGGILRYAPTDQSIMLLL